MADSRTTSSPDIATERLTGAGGAAAGRSVLRGATAIIPQELICEGEVVILALKPSLWFIVLVSVPWLIACLAALVASQFLADYFSSYWSARLAQVAILVASVRLLIGALQWLGRVYVLTDRRVMRLQGVLRIDLFQCLLSRLQQTELVLPVGERVLLCGTVLFYTAGTNAADAAWRTVAHPAHVYQTILQTIERYRCGNGANRP